MHTKCLPPGLVVTGKCKSRSQFREINQASCQKRHHLSFWVSTIWQSPPTPHPHSPSLITPLLIAPDSMSKPETKEHDTLALRLTAILRKLNDGEKLVPRELADEFNVGIRTIQRDLT